jgi:hypothetical protein
MQRITNGSQPKSEDSVRPKTATKAAVELWLKTATQIVGLAHWEITVSDDAAPDDAWADIDPHSLNPSATLRIGSGFDSQTPQKQTLILAHEISHLILAPLDRYISHLEGQHGGVWWGAWEPGYNDHHEQTTEAIARAIVPLLPAYPMPLGKAPIERR